MPSDIVRVLELAVVVLPDTPVLNVTSLLESSGSEVQSVLEDGSVVLWPKLRALIGSTVEFSL
ncbi:hypothetical protein CVT25_007537 [Psilocybe cyanescens]|uniref:Uncharacterized protein n=1 Tax=Psilocybe cyanescens TaxID=93625 RepID=A0A409XGF8_PSICY|nr:hypothetical protein CVT25_007537 [Psilocybe cyanescens]